MIRAIQHVGQASSLPMPTEELTGWKPAPQPVPWVGIRSQWIVAAGLLVLVSGGLIARAELPSPVLNTVFPPGGQAGTSVTITVDGTALDGLSALRLANPRITAEKTGANQFTLTIPSDTLPGLCDMRAVGTFGVSSPRAFFVSRLTERVEAEPNNGLDSAGQVPLDVAVNGRLEKPADVDCYRFQAHAGQRVVLECWAERIDSQLRGVLEVYDAAGKRLAANRGYAGVDPLVDFRAPADGTYVVKLFDLTFAGSAAHFYRLDIDTGPRVEFASPPVLEQGTTTRVSLFGRNLGAERSLTRQSSGGLGDARRLNSGEFSYIAIHGTHANAVGPALVAGSRLNEHAAQETTSFDCVEVEITAPQSGAHTRPSLRMHPAQMAINAFPYHHPGGHAPVLLSVTDVPVLREAQDNHSPGTAQEIAFPCEVSGQLTAGDEQDWFALEVSRGDVLWLEAFGERIGSPVDLDVAVLDPSGTRELCHLADCLENLGGYRFPSNHLDPAGRWVAPAAGRYLILVRNLIGGPSDDPRRIYRLSVRREEPDFHLAAISRRTDQPAGVSVWRGGREMLEVLVVRRRGLNGPIRVTAENLPPGVECPATWLGPGVDRAPLVLTASRDVPPFVGALTLNGHADLGGDELIRTARGGTMVWPGLPTGSGRLTDEVALAIAPEAPLVLTASLQDARPFGDTASAAADPVVYQESVLDVAVDVEQRFQVPLAAINLSGVGLPKPVMHQIAAIPAGKTRGWISFHLPSSLAPGPYTFAIQGNTEVPAASVSPGAKGNLAVTVISNPVTIRVAVARIGLELDPRTPRKIARGKTIQLNFLAERQNGFIGKIHTELVAPGGVVGLRARGVTLVGQTSSGTLQVIATDDAPLGSQPFLRLDAVGTVEDRPVYRAGRFMELEITE